MVMWETNLFFSLLLYIFYFSIVKVLNILGNLLLIHKRICLPGKTIYKTSNNMPNKDFIKNPY